MADIVLAYVYYSGWIDIFNSEHLCTNLKMFHHRTLKNVILNTRAIRYVLSSTNLTLLLRKKTPLK